MANGGTSNVLSSAQQSIKLDSIEFCGPVDGLTLTFKIYG